MYKKIITMTAWRRPEYTKQVVDNLRKCIGFEDYILLPTIEPGYPNVLKAFEDLSNCEITVNEKKLGCATNTFKALKRGFDISDFVIHIEDDTIPGIDSLKYFEYVHQRYRNDKEIFTATAYNRVSKIDPQKYFTLYRCPYFTGWMWATWKDRFEEMKNSWDFIDKYGWDNNINRNIRGKRYEICPSIGRSQNIGEHLGTYTTSANWRKCQHSDVWINNIPGALDIVSTNILPNLSHNLSNDIRFLPYFETFSNTNICLPYCYDPIYGIVGVVGISCLIYFINERSNKHGKSSP